MFNKAGKKTYRGGKECRKGKWSMCYETEEATVFGMEVNLIVLKKH